MFVGQNVANDTSDPRNIMFSKDVSRATKCICEKTGMWTIYNSPVIAFANSGVYIPVPVETAVAVMTTTKNLYDASTVLTMIATRYQDCKKQAADFLTKEATRLTVVENAVDVDRAVNTAKKSVKATEESHTANSIVAMAKDISHAVVVAQTKIDKANKSENIEIYTIARNAKLTAQLHFGLIRAAMRILESLLAAQDKLVDIKRAINVEEKTSDNADIQPIAEKLSDLLKAANDATRASAALVIAANAEEVKELDKNVSRLQNFIEKRSHKYNYICILQRDMNVIESIDGINSLYMCNAVYNLFSTYALKNVVLVITNRDFIKKSHTVLYKEAYKKISGPDSSIPVVCVNFNTKTKSEGRAILTYKLNYLRYSDTGKEYTPVLPDASRYNFTYKLKNALSSCYKFCR